MNPNYALEADVAAIRADLHRLRADTERMNEKTTEMWFSFSRRKAILERLWFVFACVSVGACIVSIVVEIVRARQ